MNATVRPQAISDWPGLDPVIGALLRRHGDAVDAILFYGSCLRSGDLFDGVVDLYLIVRDYRSFYISRLQALANRLLPPNVFYLEVPVGKVVVRLKYAVVSERDFAHGVSRRWFHSYLWGRFTQPFAVAFARDDACRAQMEANQMTAVRTFLERVLPRVEAAGTVRQLWQQGLALSYRAELRAESSARSVELTDHALGHYCAVTRAAAQTLRWRLELYDDDKGMCYLARVPRLSRGLSRVVWPIRQLQGKLLSIARLVKALFTFDGGLDYIAWKLERHSGQRVEIPERVRRRPLIYVWGLFWQLYRRGVFR